jgi:hypothetical protein
MSFAAELSLVFARKSLWQQNPAPYPHPNVKMSFAAELSLVFARKPLWQQNPALLPLYQFKQNRAKLGS